MTQSFDAAVAAWAEHQPPKFPLGVAFSGGADSTALLVACNERWPGQVIALHVNHQLQPAAVDFEHHCRDVCRSLGIPLRVRRVDAVAPAGVSPEDAARKARYKALADLSLADTAHAAISLIAVAQHADDQVETVMLALGRGAGVAGLAGMTPAWQTDTVAFCRPLLQVSGNNIRLWLHERRVQCIEDPTNADTRFMRNRIRHDLIPALYGVFPHIAQTISRSARHAAQAQELLDELARDDVAPLLDEVRLALHIGRLRCLSRPRQANALRWWLKGTHGAIATNAQLDELLNQLRDCSTRGHSIHIKIGQGYVQRRGPLLHWYNPALLPDKK